MAKLGKIQMGLSTIGQAMGFRSLSPLYKSTDNDLNAILYSQLVNNNMVVFYNFDTVDYIDKGYRGNAEVYTIINKIVSKTIAAPCYLYIDNEDQKSAKYKRYRQFKKDSSTSKHALNQLYVKKALDFAPEKNDLSRLIESPNPHQTWGEMMELFRIFYFTQGEAFLYRETAEDSDIALNLNVAPANLMEPIFGGDFDDVITGWKLKNFIDNSERKLDAKDVFHLKMANPHFDQFGSQLRGQSPLLAGLKYLCQSDEGVKAWANSLANEGAKGIVSPNHPDPKLWLTPDQTKTTTDLVEQKIHGSRNKNKVVVSGMPLQYTQIGLSPEALNIIEGLKYAGVKLCNLWGVPAVLFEEDPTYQNKKEARKEFASDVILPYMTKEEDALNKWLVEPFALRDKRKYVLDYDTSQYDELKPTKDDIEAFKEFCTINEIRILQGFDEVDEEYADQIFISQGKIPLSDYSSGIDLSYDSVNKSIDYEDSIVTKAEFLKGCLMFYPDIDINEWVNGIRKLVPNHIVEEYEFEPHLTILYGFDDAKMNIGRLKYTVGEFIKDNPISIKADRIGVFSNENDVIKVNVEDLNGNLTRLNKMVKNQFEYQNEYPDYKPHITIAYVKKGSGSYLDGSLIDLKDYGLKDLNTGIMRYSDGNKNKTVI